MHTKDKKEYIFAAAAVVLTFLSGGMFWQGCIIPMLLLCAVIALGKIGVRTAVYIIVYIPLLAASLICTKGDMQAGIYESEKLLCFALALSAGVAAGKRYSFLAAAAVFAAVLGLAAYCGLDIAEYTFWDRGVLRLQSSLGYANTMACLLACGYFALLEKTDKRIFRYAAMGILIAMYLTFSKACIPIFLLVGTLYIYKERKHRTFFAIANLAAVIVCALTFAAVKRHMPFLAAVIILCGIAAAGEIKMGDKYFRLWLVLGAVGIAFVIVAVIKNPSLVTTLSKRMQYSNDALGLIGKNPIFGNGAGSWRVLQFGVQSDGYDVKYLHNSPLQLIIENGFLFTALFYAPVVYAFCRAVKHRERAAAAILLVITLHSFVDLDLSFALMLTIYGAVSGMCMSDEKASESERFRLPLVCIVIAFTLAIVSYMTAEYFIRGKMEKCYINGDFKAAKNYSETLDRLCPGDSSLKVTEADMALKSGDAEGAKRLLENAVRLSENDPEIFRQYIEYASDNADDIMKYISMNPKQERAYTNAKSMAERLYSAGKLSKVEYADLDEKIENYREKEHVTDRNRLLETLSEK